MGWDELACSGSGEVADSTHGDLNWRPLNVTGIHQSVSSEAGEALPSFLEERSLISSITVCET